MSNHDQLRKDKTCLNCRHVVENRFCPNCGQKNEDTHKTFHHLFLHFFEDLTHYENAFWKTIKNLLLKPGSLTKEYLSGKRLSFLAPVRLYIFISFVTFLLLTLLPKENNETLELKKEKEITLSDTPTKNKKANEILNLGYKSVKELDSIQLSANKKEKLNTLEYWVLKKIQLLKDHNDNEEIINKFKESFIHNFPKVLFIYLPLFAFVLWLFHDKKKWYYFDHGIFTLHYFSFLLLIILIQFLFNKFIDLLIVSSLLDLISVIINFTLISWMFYYFLPAHRNFYNESILKSVIKTGLLFIINIFIIIFILTFFALYTIISIH